MDKLLMRSPVARDDVEGLRGYAVALRLTMNVIANIPHGKSELEHPKTVRKLVSKLSFGLQDRWRTMSADSKIERGDYLSFEDFVRFVERAVRIDSDPLFGKDALQRISSTNDNRATYKRKPISVNVVSGRKGVRGQVNGDLGVTSSSLESDECVFCRGGHRVNRCDTFLEQNPKQRFDIIREVGGCFICLKAGHLSRNCPNPVACSLCARYHHDLLHFNSGEPRRNFTANRSKEREFNYKEGQVSSKPSPHAKEFVPIGAGVTGRDGHSNYETIIERNVPVNSLASYEAPTVGSMAVVPVVLRNSRGKVVRTSAFLDNGSSISFCTKELLKDLCASPADVLEVNLGTETLHSKKSERTRVICNIQGRGEYEKRWINLPCLYAVARIPVSREDVWRDEYSDRWPHLRDVVVRSIGEIGLMLGSDALQAHEPLEIRSSDELGSPYGVRTRLGWTVAGILNSEKFVGKYCGVGVVDEGVNNPPSLHPPPPSVNYSCCLPFTFIC